MPKTCPSCHVTYSLDFEVCPRDGIRLEPENGAQAEWPNGMVIAAKYRISRQLGEDEVTAIYEAHTLSLNAPRVIRVLKPRFAAAARASEEFRKAADLVQKAAQANVIAVEGRGNAEDGRPFLITEFFRGQALAELMQKERPLEPQRACAIARQVALALSAAHRLGLLHLVLTPSNILVSGPPDEESVKVQGFGTAYVLACCTRNGGSSSGPRLRDHLPANPRYASPEMALGRPPALLDERSDLYSLGVILYEMLTGWLPFRGRDASRDSGEDGGSELAVATLVARLEDPPTPLDAGYGGLKVPAPLGDVVMQLLERRPELRLPSAQDVIEKMALVQSRIATLARPRLPTELAESKMASGSAEVIAAREPAEVDEPRPRQELDLVGPSSSSSDVGLGAVSSKGVVQRPSSPYAAAVQAVGAAVGSEPVAARPYAADLFQTRRPPDQPRFGRWALAAVVVLVLAAGTWFFITRARTQWLGAGPLSPIKSDELRRVEGANPPPSSPSQATSKPAMPPQNGTPAASQPAQAAPQPAVSGPSASPPESAPSATNEAGSGGKQTGGTLPAGKSATGQVSKPSGTPTSTGSEAASPEDVAAQVKRAIAAGDVFFELGQYDYAIRAYEGPLKYDPANQELKLKIERARKAKAAEEQYLGQ